MTSKAARFITQLMAEIAERDARIAEQLREITQLRRELGIVQEVANSALKAQQPSAGGAYSSDPLACTGCAAGCFRCRSSAGVVVGALVSALEGIVHDERVPNEVSQDYAALLIEARRLNHCRAQAVQICKLGSYGAAYDAPDTCRAYTYAAQPGNDIAYRLGDCLRAAHCDGGGDFIDFGLALLRRLQDKGFGVFQIAAPSANSEQARSCVTCNGVGIIGHSTLCPECAAAPSAQQKESGDE